MDLVTVTCALLLVGAASFGVGVYRLDRELRHLLPARLERRRLPDRPLPDAPLADQIHLLVLQCIPPHWRRRLHAERGAGLAGRLYLFLGLAWYFAMMGLGLLARVVARA